LNVAQALEVCATGSRVDFNNKNIAYIIVSYSFEILIITNFGCTNENKKCSCSRQRIIIKGLVISPGLIGSTAQFSD